jgi:hypothetical protein
MYKKKFRNSDGSIKEWPKVSFQSFPRKICKKLHENQTVVILSGKFKNYKLEFQF